MKYKELGLGVYAFSADAHKTVDNLVTNLNEVKDLLYWVESESVVLIKGPEKSGKTRLALEIIDNFKGEGKVIYIDLNTYNKEVDVGHLLVGNQSLFRRFFDKLPEDMILIVDNAHDLNNDFYRRLQYFFDQGYLKSVVFIQKSEVDLNLPDSINSRIGNKIIDLKLLDRNVCLEIAGIRFDGFLNNNNLEKIWGKSNDLVSFFENCQKIADSYLDEGRKSVDNNFIEKVLK